MKENLPEWTSIKLQKKKLDKTREQVGKKYYIRWMGKPTSNKIMFQKLDRSLDFMLHLLLLWNQ